MAQGALQSKVNTMVMVLIVIVVLFSTLAAMIPVAQDTGDSLTDEGACEDEGHYWNTSTEVCQYNSTNTTAMDYSSVPLGNLFGGNGIVFIIVMAGILILVIMSVMRQYEK